MFEVLFLTTFCNSIWKKVHNLKEIVNMQGLFVLTVGYIDMTTYPPTKYYYIIERVYFIYRLLVLFINTLSFLLLLYTTSWKYKFYITITMKKCYSLLYHVRS